MIPVFAKLTTFSKIDSIPVSGSLHSFGVSVSVRSPMMIPAGVVTAPNAIIAIRKVVGINPLSFLIVFLSSPVSSFSEKVSFSIPLYFNSRATISNDQADSHNLLNYLDLAAISLIEGEDLISHSKCILSYHSLHFE